MATKKHSSKDAVTAVHPNERMQAHVEERTRASTDRAIDSAESLEDPGILLDRAKALIELVRFHVEADRFHEAYSRAVECGRIERGLIECPVGELDDGAAAVALYTAWECIAHAQMELAIGERKKGIQS